MSSAAKPWMKFFPRDWRGDQALRVVSLAARGLWMECLCIMHEARPYGHLLVNGRRVGDDALARMVGISADEVRSLMAELREAGVFDMTREGVVFSRRMVRDQEKSAKCRKAVIEKRWAVEKRGTGTEPPAQVPDSKKFSSRPNRSFNRPPNRVPIAHIPESRTKSPLTPLRSDSRTRWERDMWTALSAHIEHADACVSLLGERPDLCDGATEREDSRRGSGWPWLLGELLRLCEAEGESQALLAGLAAIDHGAPTPARQ